MQAPHSGLQDLSVVLRCGIAIYGSRPTQSDSQRSTHMNVLNKVRTAVQKRAAYVRLRNEIASMPQDVAIDLGMFREDAARIASKAIYG